MVTGTRATIAQWGMVLCVAGLVVILMIVLSRRSPRTGMIVYYESVESSNLDITADDDALPTGNGSGNRTGIGSVVCPGPSSVVVVSEHGV